MHPPRVIAPDAAPARDAPSADDLLARARAGDRDAENALFGALHARILAVAKKKVWDEQAAMDLAQDTVRTAFEKYRDAEMPRGLLAWVFTILHNKVGNYVKRRRVEAAHGMAAGAWLDWDTIGVGAGEEYAAIDLVESIEKALRRASPESRTIVRLLVAGGGREDVRRAFGNEPIGTTDSRISRCRERLLRDLEALWKEGSGR